MHTACRQSHGMGWTWSSQAWLGWILSSSELSLCPYTVAHKVCAGLILSHTGPPPSRREGLVSLSTHSDISIFNVQKFLTLNYIDFVYFILLKFFILHKSITWKNFWRWNILQVKHTSAVCWMLAKPRVLPGQWSPSWCWLVRKTASFMLRAAWTVTLSLSFSLCSSVIAFCPSYDWGLNSSTS